MLFILIHGASCSCACPNTGPFVREHSSRELRKAVPQTIYQDQLVGFGQVAGTAFIDMTDKNFKRKRFPIRARAGRLRQLLSWGYALDRPANGQICFKPYVYSQPEKKLGTNLKQFTL
ncbi:MAG: hypothetical protein R2792_16540 [Saprospiraceae bacterium]